MTATWVRRRHSRHHAACGCPSVEVAGDAMTVEDAAVVLADESGHPYDWEAIVADRKFFRLCYRVAARRLESDGDGYLRLRVAAQILEQAHATRLQ